MKATLCTSSNHARKCAGFTKSKYVFSFPIEVQFLTLPARSSRICTKVKFSVIVGEDGDGGTRWTFAVIASFPGKTGDKPDKHAIL